MSENPTPLLFRAVTGAAVVAALAMPAAAVAKPDDKGKKTDAPAACADAKQSKHPHGGPPGLNKKAGQMPECKAHEDGGAQADANANAAAPPIVVNVTVAAPPAPAPAPVSTVAASKAGKCEKRGVFRITLHKGRVRTARVMLNGRAIPVTRTKKRTSVLLDMRGRKNKNFTMRHTVVTKKGRLKTGTRRFRTCG